MKQHLAVTICLLIFELALAQSKITISANFPDAQFYKMRGNTIIQPALGIGSIQLKLEKKEQNRIIVMKEGYQALIQEYPRSRKWPKNVIVSLENRIVEINAEPYDANIYVNGSFAGQKTHKVVVRKGENVTVELKKKGFKSFSKTYYNVIGQETPPISEYLKLVDRVINIRVNPADADIIVDKKKVGIGVAEVIIPENQCVSVRVEKEGYISEEQVFCNKASEVDPPFSQTFQLKDRLVKIVSTPSDAEIKVDGKVVGVGEYDLKIQSNNCVEVIFLKEGYLTVKKNYCNSKEFQEPPIRDHIELMEDEAWSSSVETDLANVNFNIVVNPEITEDQAWKLLSSIVTTEFDVLEVTDKETGYLRTSWQVRSFKGSGTIRTRVIVKLGDSNPLKYVIKISSERSDKVGVNVKDDQLFTEWPRILKKYQYIIEEAQSRL